MVLDTEAGQVVVDDLEERVGDRGLPGPRSEPGVLEPEAEELAHRVALVVAGGFRVRVVARLRLHGGVGVVGDARAELGLEAPIAVPRGPDGVPPALGGAGEGGGGRCLQCRFHLGRGLGCPSETRQREPRVEARELLDVWVCCGADAQGLQRSLVVLLAVADKADVVADPLGARLGLEDLGEGTLRAVVPLRREVGDAELVQHGQIVRGLGASLLEGRDRGLGLLLGHEGEARVVEALQVVRILGQRLLQDPQGLVVALVLVGEDGLGHQHVGLGLLGARGRGLECKAQEHRGEQVSGEAMAMH